MWISPKFQYAVKTVIEIVIKADKTWKFKHEQCADVQTHNSNTKNYLIYRDYILSATLLTLLCMNSVKYVCA